VEFSQMFRRFGSDVTLINSGPRLLAREDADVSEAVAEILTKDGIRLFLDTQTSEATSNGGGSIRLKIRAPQGETFVEGTHLLCAVGRTPNTKSLAPEQSGITTDARGFIPVDPSLQTNVKGIYAIGDVNGGPAFTHISYDDYRILRANLLDGKRQTTKGRMIPYTVFIDPQLGRIGMTENEARAAGRQIKVATMPMSHVARALETDESRGFMKVITDERSGRILGAAILGIEGGEIMAQLQIAMMGKLRYEVLRDGIFAHPTLAESLNNLFA
jgi:pyruvate/2-oxoglutarate dehydrogenase complex dihydrolipoamide dehydrogenase (E3) component